MARMDTDDAKKRSKKKKTKKQNPPNRPRPSTTSCKTQLSPPLSCCCYRTHRPRRSQSHACPENNLPPTTPSPSLPYPPHRTPKTTSAPPPLLPCRYRTRLPRCSQGRGWPQTLPTLAPVPGVGASLRPAPTLPPESSPNHWTKNPRTPSLNVSHLGQSEKGGARGRTGGGRRREGRRKVE